MKDLGQTAEQMYPSASDAKEKIHPEVSVMTSLFDTQPKVGEKVNVEFQCVVESISKDTVRLKLIQGEEVESQGEEDTEAKTLMG